MPNVGPIEIIVVILILLVIFGPKRIPELGRSIGQGMRNFKQSVTGRDREDEARELEHRDAPTQGETRAAAPREREPVAASAAPVREPHEGATTPEAPQAAEHSREPGS